MKSQALICDDQQHFTLADVTLPDPGPEDVLVRAQFSGVSIGTEFALIRNKISWGPYPLCPGYQAVGVVEKAGTLVTGFKPGDQVYYRQGPNITLSPEQIVSSVSGTHAAHAVFHYKNCHGLALLPAGANPAVASMFVMPAVGLYGVNMANPGMGETVVVVGAGMIGLGVIAACSHRGCRVIAIDLDDSRLAVAKDLGADVLINSGKTDPVETVKQVAPDMADVVFESTGLPALINCSLQLCKRLGKFVWQGNYGVAPVPMDFMSAHGRRLTMFFPCDDGGPACRQAVLKNIISGALPWKRTITHQVEAAAAPALYERINRNQAPEVLGAVIHWSD